MPRASSKRAEGEQTAPVVLVRRSGRHSRSEAALKEQVRQALIDHTDHPEDLDEDAQE